DELMALADVYADALLQAADEKGEAERVAAEFADLIRYLDRDRDFERFLTASSVDDDPRRDSLEKLFRGRMSDLLLNLLQVLNNRGRLDLVRVVYRAVQLRMERRHHQQEVVVETAMALTDDLRQAIVKHVGEYIGKEPLLIERVVPELIGGVVIRINDIQIDGSVSSRIRTLRQKFSRRAVVEIPSGRGVEL
ncbi:MAG TPA: ATP synthase F1 subunit delta, partial [Phycisphaerae bacterium]|nr:ATP synthase F1 subunit delta [Phycisphaerae bacterium]